MNRMQLERFRAALATLPAAPASLSSSGGVLLGKDYVFDMVRSRHRSLWRQSATVRPNPLSTVAVLTGPHPAAPPHRKGESVGYGATFTASRPTALATVDLAMPTA